MANNNNNIKITPIHTSIIVADSERLENLYTSFFRDTLKVDLKGFNNIRQREISKLINEKRHIFYISTYDPDKIIRKQSNYICKLANKALDSFYILLNSGPMFSDEITDKKTLEKIQCKWFKIKGKILKKNASLKCYLLIWTQCPNEKQCRHIIDTLGIQFNPSFQLPDYIHISFYHNNYIFE